MTAKQIIENKMSAARSKLNPLLDIAIEERTDDQKAEMVSLSETLQNLEPELRAANLAAPTKPETLDAEKPEDRERRELRGKAKLSGFISAVLEDRRIDGAELECFASVQLQSGKFLSKCSSARTLKRGRSPRARRLRIKFSQSRLSPAIFQRSAAVMARRSICRALELVTRAFVVLGTSSLSGGPKAKSAAADETGRCVRRNDGATSARDWIFQVYCRGRGKARRHGKRVVDEPVFGAVRCDRQSSDQRLVEAATALSTDC